MDPADVQAAIDAGWQQPDYLPTPLLPSNVRCSQCGSAVLDQQTHTAWHLNLAQVITSLLNHVHPVPDPLGSANGDTPPRQS